MTSKATEGLGLLLMPGKPGKGKGPAAPAAEAEGDEKTLAAEGVLKAIKRGDAGALSRALEQHYACCQGEHEGESVSGDLDGDDSDDY